MPKIVKNFVSELKVIINKAQTEAEILIYGEVGEDFWGDGSSISANSFTKELNKLPASVAKINLRINSPGGSVFDGMTIYNRLKQHKCSVDVYVDGIAASIASIIAMAGDNIYMGEGTQLMIHKPMTGTRGNRDDHDKAISILDGIESQMVGIYSRKTGKSREELKMMLSDDCWMSAEKAVEMGFATDIMGEADGIKAAASMIQSSKWIDLRKAPEMKDTKKQKLKLEELKNKIEGSIARISNAALPKA